ncbi:MAG: asparagine synthetase B, partial [Candidatus Cloacimonetes bacterium]|nr:asparagine synthetase B [Candidatus Cloacimonadota bacterium]
MKIKAILLCIVFLVIFISAELSAEILIPMDRAQTNHLKAYGVTFQALKLQLSSRWLLNYRGGSFIIPDSPDIIALCNIRGVYYERISSANVAQILAEIEDANMNAVVLEKEPSIAIYTPPNSLPWDDAVTMALTYAEIEYETLWDEEVLAGKLDDYDWLHLHHEDFTGQYGKFYSSFRNTAWYQEEVRINEEMASRLGYEKVWQLKHTVAEKIRQYVENGGFLFAMCAAVDTIDIALSLANVDVCETPFDVVAIDPDFRSKFDFNRTFAFEEFELETNPYVYEFSTIDASDYAQ